MASDQNADDRREAAEVVRMMTAAGEQGHALAQYHLGVMYDQGQGVPQSGALAVEWYRKAADQGRQMRSINLGRSMYEHGRGGLPQSDALAVEWYRKAADLGCMYEMACICTSRPWQWIPQGRRPRYEHGMGFICSSE